MPALGPIISVKPRLGVDLLFTLLFEAQDNPGLSRSANWREHVWRRFLVFIPAVRLRLQRLVSHLGEYIAYSIVKHIYLLFNKLIFNTHTALAMPGTQLLLLFLLLSTRTLICHLRSYLNHFFLFFFCLGHRKVPGIQQALNKYFFINITTEMYLNILNPSGP